MSQAVASSLDPSLVLHQRTQQEIERFLSAPGHSLLLVGQEGSGKRFLAEAVLSAILGLKTGQLTKDPYYLLIEAEKKVITIEQIRQIQQFVRLKTLGHGQIRRAILVSSANLMTVEAQNAFLKLLEGPPADTVIVLTADSRDSLLPTILSRAPQIVVRPVSQAALTEHFLGLGHNPNQVTRAYYMSQGQMGLTNRLLSEEQDDELLDYIDKAKQLLAMSSFERLTYVDQFVKQKLSLNNLLWALQSISQAALQQAAAKEQDVATRHWQNILRQVLRAKETLPSNPQAKLLLTNLVLHL